jgi:hypothetical protein
VFLTACAPAFLELVLVPVVAPWCYRQRHTSFVARRGLEFLRLVALNLPLHVPHEDMSTHRSRMALRSVAISSGHGVDPLDTVRESEVSPFITRVNYLARRVVERGFSQIAITMSMGLTFGLAAPWIALIAALSALLQLVHHLVLLEQVQEQFQEYLFIQVPFMVPWTVGVTLVTTTLLFWVAGSIRYLDTVRLALGGVVTLGGVIFLFVVARKALSIKGSASRRSSVVLLSPLLSPRVEERTSHDDFGDSNSPSQDSNGLRTTSL